MPSLPTPQKRVQNNFHDRALPSARPELVSKYIEPLKDPLWDRGLLHFYKSLQVRREGTEMER